MIKNTTKDGPPTIILLEKHVFLQCTTHPSYCLDFNQQSPLGYHTIWQHKHVPLKDSPLNDRLNHKLWKIFHIHLVIISNNLTMELLVPSTQLPHVERRGGTSRLGVSLETHAEIVSKAEVKAKL